MLCFKLNLWIVVFRPEGVYWASCHGLHQSFTDVTIDRSHRMRSKLDPLRCTSGLLYASQTLNLSRSADLEDKPEHQQQCQHVHGDANHA